MYWWRFQQSGWWIRTLWTCQQQYDEESSAWLDTSSACLVLTVGFAKFTVFILSRKFLNLCSMFLITYKILETTARTYMHKFVQLCFQFWGRKNKSWITTSKPLGKLNSHNYYLNSKINSFCMMTKISNTNQYTHAYSI